MGAEPSSPVPSVSPSDAEARTGIKFRQPKTAAITGNMKAVYQDTSASGNPEICIHFDNGILVGEENWKEQPDFAHEIAMDNDPAHHEPPATPGTNWILVKVAGFQGKQLPQPAIMGADGKLSELPPMLEWWDSGVKYMITTWKTGVSGQQLLDIANSMY